MRTILLIAAALAMAGGPAAHASRSAMEIEKVTPILYVEAIEPVLPFWVDRLGFESSSEVYEGDRLGFVILHKDGVELMYQTRASMQADLPDLADLPMGGTILFIEAASLDPVLEALAGVEVVIPRRQTSYGADEIFFREPGGHLIGFAAF